VKELTVNHTVDSNGVSTFNGVVDPRYIITKLIGFLRVRIPENQNDKDFSREFMKVSVDVSKLLNGQANFLVKMIAKIVLESCDRKVEFPLAKVRSTMIASISILKPEQGIYRISNVTFDDSFVPDIYYFIKVQVVWDLKVVGRIKDGKKTVWFGNGNGRIEFRPTDRSKERNATTAEFEEIVRTATRFFVMTQNWNF
jgi:hypothetical protein